MLKNNAVVVTVAFALFVTFITVSYTFYQLYNTNNTKHIETIFQKNSLISQIYYTYVTKQVSRPLFEANLALQNLEEIKNDSLQDNIIRYGRVLKNDGYIDILVERQPTPFLLNTTQDVERVNTIMLEYQEQIYFYIEGLGESTVILDLVSKPYQIVNLIWAYISIVSILAISFGLIIYRLRPLQKLRRQIARFGEGDMSVSFAINGTDEIALIANELESTQNNIKRLIESRSLFLRNIMHELKTPIAKGRIAATMLEDEKNSKRFENIFTRLESLIGEFALIEEVASNNQHIQKNEYRLIDIIDGAIDMAMVDADCVEVSVDSSFKLMVDYRLFATVVKNLIDNAIKYSSDKRVKIYIEDFNIVFENSSQALKKPLEYYTEAFTKDNSTKDSFGLGLYIVDAILKEHDFRLRYEYIDDKSRFIIETKRR